MLQLNKNTFLSGVFLLVLATGCETTNGNKTSSVKAADDSRPCSVNMTITGSFFAGKTYKTHQDFPTGDKAKAIDKLAAALGAEGWQIISSSKDTGVLSAATTVSYGQGKTAPLNAVVTESGTGGIRVSLVFVTSGGVVASEKELRNTYCKLMDAVGH